MQNTPLHLAAIFGHAGAGAALVNGGAELMARNNVGIMPLHAASLGGAAPPYFRREIYKLFVNTDF